MDESSDQVRVDYGGWMSGPSFTLATCRFCDAEIRLVGGKWHATRYADLSGFCPGSNDDRHEPRT